MAEYSASNPPKFGVDPAGFVKYYYGAEYLNPDGTYNKGIKFTTGTDPYGPKVTSYKTTPETHPWLYPKPGDVHTDGKVYGASPDAFRVTSGPSRGGVVVPKVSEAQKAANYASRSYSKNPQGNLLDPKLLQGIAVQGKQSENPFITTPNGTYTFQKGVSKYNPMGVNSAFSGSGVNYQNDVWGQIDPTTGMYPGQATMESLAGSPEWAAYYASMGITPGGAASQTSGSSLSLPNTGRRPPVNSPPASGGAPPASGAPPAGPSAPYGGYVPLPPASGYTPKPGSQNMPSWYHQQAPGMDVQTAMAAALRASQ